MRTTIGHTRAATAHPHASREELRGLILQLRWMGMEDEALELSERLGESAALDCPLIEPRDTD